MAEWPESQFTPPPERMSEMTKKEKLGITGLVVLSVVIIFLGFKQLGSNIKSPFAVFLAAANTSPEVSSAPTITDLKNKDTDHDGLSDYDELYIYHTSPYLADTDSDGIPDGQEVKQGTDPNCPQGKQCGTSELANPTAAGLVTSTLAGSGLNIPSSDQLLLQSLFGSNPDPKILREFLTKQGVTKDVLSKVSDTDLIKIFQEITTPPSGAPTVGAAPALNNIKDLNNISAADLRQLLKQQGIPDADLAKIKDADLLKAFQEALKQ